MKKLLLCFTLLVLASCAYGGMELEIGGEWEQHESIPLALGEFSSVEGNGSVYMGGGFSPGGGTRDEFLKYDYETKQVSSLPSLPAGLHHTSFAYLDGYVYVIGGWEDLNFSATSHFFRYNIEDEEWESLEGMPSVRAAHRAIGYNGGIFVFGGVGENERDVLRYDVEREEWEVVAELPRKREHHTVEEVDGRIYLISGRWNTRNLGSIDVYNIENDEFSRIEGVKGVSGHGSAVSDEQIHILGGENLVTKETYTTHQVVDMSTERVSVVESMPLPRHGHRVHEENGSLLVFGGALRAEYDTFKSLTGMVHVWR